MAVNPNLTPEQRADFAQMRRNMRRDIESAEGHLATNVLLGQGFVCVAVSHVTALTTTRPRPQEPTWVEYRFIGMDGDLSGVTHWSKADAEKVAQFWNDGITAKVAADLVERLSVVVMHRNDALKQVIATAQSILEMTEGHGLD